MTESTEKLAEKFIEALRNDAGKELEDGRTSGSHRYLLRKVENARKFLRLAEAVERTAGLPYPTM
jgi:hypothetical protein